MQEFDIDAFNEFIKDLYEQLDIDDYIDVVEALADTRPKNTHGRFISFKSICHCENPSECGYNLALNTDNMIFSCYSHDCGSMDLISLVKRRFELIREPKTTFKCVQWICETLDIPFEFQHKEVKKKEIIYDYQKELGKYRKKSKLDNGDIKVYNDNILNYFPRILS